MNERMNKPSHSQPVHMSAVHRVRTNMKIIISIQWSNGEKKSGT